MSIYEIMELPTAARIDRVVPKKQFYDNGDLSSNDKKLFDHVEKIYWRYALKTENSFIQPYRDEEKDYPEIEVLEVNLRAEKQLKRLAEVIIHAIPYPMLLFFTLGDMRRLYMGKLRQSQADSERMALVAMEDTNWRSAEDDFWPELSLRKMPGANFCQLYEGWFDAISKSHLAALSVDANNISGDKARETLQRITAIEQEMNKLRKQMKAEIQFNRKMELNTRLQKLKREMKKITEQGSREQ